MRVPLFSIALGIVFGFAISWGQFIDPDRIREMLLLEDLYLYAMMATAVATGFLGTRLLRSRRARALATGEPVTWSTEPPQRRHFVGAALFGVGWAITDSCPAPIAGQLANGIGWALFTLAGVMLGIALYLRQQERPRRRAAALAATAQGG